MAPAAQNPSMVNTPRHLPVENGSSSVQAQPENPLQYSKETGLITRRADFKLEQAELKPFPRMAFFVLFVVDIIDVFAGMTWVYSIFFNIVVGIFVSKYVMDRIEDYKKTLDRITKVARSVAKLGGKSLKTKMTRIVAKILKKAAGNNISKATRKKILIFILYGLVPILQIIASWAFFIFMYYRQEKKLVKDINETAEMVAQAKAQAEAEIELSLQ